jgi:hypothetical protein
MALLVIESNRQTFRNDWEPNNFLGLMYFKHGIPAGSVKALVSQKCSPGFLDLPNSRCELSSMPICPKYPDNLNTVVLPKKKDAERHFVKSS